MAQGDGSFGFTLVDGRIFFEVRWQGADLCLILDTGARGLLLDERAVSSGETVARIVLGHSEAHTPLEGRLVKLRFPVLGTEGATEVTAAVADLTYLAECFDHPLSGIVGFEYLKDYVLVIDYPSRRLRFHHRPPRWSLESAVAFDLRGAALIVPGTADGRSGLRFRIDTGAAGVSLRESILDGLGAPRVEGRIREVADLAGTGVTVRHFYRIRRLTLGPYAFEDVDVTSRPEDRPAEADGLVGTELLEDFVLTIDYLRQRIALTKPDVGEKAPPCPDGTSSS